MIFDLIKHAKQLLFNNSETKLNATNVQEAIAEVDHKTNVVSGASVNIIGENNVNYGTLTFYKIGKAIMVTFSSNGNSTNGTKVALVTRIPYKPAYMFQLITSSLDDVNKRGCITCYSNGTMYINLSGEWTYGTAVYFEGD